MKELTEKEQEILEELGWTLDYTGDGRVELFKHSPAGEDFSIVVDVEDFLHSVMEYAEDFDEDEHNAFWLQARDDGVGGVPSTRELVEDAHDIQLMLDELSDALNGVEHEPEQESGRHMLVEVVEREIQEPIVFESYEEAYAEMRSRFCAVTGISEDEADGYSDDNYDTCLGEYKAFTEKYGNNYDWAIFKA